MSGPFLRRTFDSSRDLGRVIEFLVRVREHCGPGGFYHVGDFSWAMYLFEVRERPKEFIQVWETVEGELAGFSIFYPPSTVDIQSAPWMDDREALEAEMLDWAMGIRGEQPVEPDQECRLTVSIFERDERLLAFLGKYGARREESHQVFMYLHLADEIEEPVLPEGYLIRPVRDDEWEARGELQRSVWPWSKVGAESYPRLRSMPGYLAELDLVAVSPEGDLCSFGLCWLDESNRVGEFEPVGTNPAFQRRGLSRALQFEALRRLKALGGESCVVYPRGGDLPACGLYESVGFRELGKHWEYSISVA